MKAITKPITQKYANRIMYSDIHPFEIVRQLSDKMIEVRRMDAVITEESKKKLADSFVPGGFLGHTDNSLQEYTFSSNTENPIEVARKHKDGYWYTSYGYKHLLSETPEKLYDYNF